MSVLEFFRLDNRKAIVTGGASGLGEGMAIALAEAGADVVIADVNLEDAKRVQEAVDKTNPDKTIKLEDKKNDGAEPVRTRESNKTEEAKDESSKPQE